MSSTRQDNENDRFCFVISKKENERVQTDRL